MRAFAWFLGVLVAAGLAAASIAYPVFELTSRIAPWPFHRVYGRIAMLAAVGALVFWCRRFGVANRRELGYGLPWRRFCAVAHSSARSASSRRAPAPPSCSARASASSSDPASLASPAHLAASCAHRVLLGFAVALIEETVMRGAMHTAIARESGQMAALAHRALVRRAAFLCQDPRRLARLDERLSLAGRSFAPLGNFGAGARFVARVGPWESGAESHARAHRQHRGRDRLARRLGGGAAHAAGSHAAREPCIPSGSDASTGCWATGCCPGRRHRPRPLVDARASGCPTRPAWPSGASSASLSSRSSGSSSSR